MLSVIAEVPYSHGQDRLAAMAPKLRNLPYGAKLMVEAYVEANAHGEWHTHIAGWSLHEGSFYGGEVVLTCASVRMQYPDVTSAASKRHVPEVCSMDATGA